MLRPSTLLLSLSCFGGDLLSAVSSQALPPGTTTTPYTPYTVQCPNREFVRRAGTVNSEELSYTTRRKQAADASLREWLKRTWPCEAEIDTCDLPKIAISLSGGGTKAALIVAGVVQAFDSRDSDSSVSGLLQSSTYISALSGGSTVLGSVYVNDFSAISPLKASLYDTNFINPFALPLANTADIIIDVNGKANAGYPTTLLDVYGRALAYNNFGQDRGAVNVTWSSITAQSSFASAEAPFPLFQIADTRATQGVCSPSGLEPVWEVSPVEFGSWDPAVDAFFPTQYLGTTVQGDKPLDSSKCTEGFDNAGIFVGISSDILTDSNFGLDNAANCTTDLNQLGLLVYSAFQSVGPNVQVNPYGVIPNPFYQSTVAGSRSSEPDLYMLDGGFTGEGIPLNAWFHPERDIDVVFAIDALSSAATNVTDGTALYNTSLSTTRLGLTRFPPVPDPATFAALNLSSSATFFGCRDASLTTLVYIPDGVTAPYTATGFTLTSEEVQGIFLGGVDMATQGGDEGWGGCVACAVMHKKLQRVPAACERCLDRYCWSP